MRTATGRPFFEMVTGSRCTFSSSAPKFVLASAAGMLFSIRESLSIGHNGQLAHTDLFEDLGQERRRGQAQALRDSLNPSLSSGLPRWTGARSRGRGPSAMARWPGTGRSRPCHCSAASRRWRCAAIPRSSLSSEVPENHATKKLCSAAISSKMSAGAGVLLIPGCGRLSSTSWISS